MCRWYSWRIVKSFSWNFILNSCSSASFCHQASHWQIILNIFFRMCDLKFAPVYKAPVIISCEIFFPSKIKAIMEKHYSKLFLEKIKGRGYEMLNKSILWNRCWCCNSLYLTHHITNHYFGEILPGTFCVLILPPL